MSSTTSGIKGRTLGVALAGVIAIAALAAVLATRGGDAGSNTQSKTSIAGGAAPGEFQEVKSSGAALAPLAGGEADAAIGVVAPELSGYSFSGFPVSVKPASDGAPTMLVFLAHWCPHCNAEMPRLVKWYESGLVPDDLRVIGVATGSRKDQPNWPPSEWVESFDWPFEVLADTATNDAAKVYGVSGYPFMVVLDAQGKVVARHSGEMEESEIPGFVNGALGR